MTKAYNLSQLANYVDTSGLLDGAALNSPAPESEKLTTADFSIEQSGTKLIFKYNGTTIASLDSTGNFVSLANVTSNGTP